MGAARKHNMLVFAKKYWQDLSSTLQDQPIFFPVIWSQACLESGYASSNLAKNNNNFFGVTTGGKGYRTFDTPSDAFKYQIALLTSGIYAKGGVPTATTPYQQIRNIAHAGYYSMNNDETLPKSQTGNAVWSNSKQLWIGIHFTAQQSEDWYVNTLTAFINDALTVLPYSKITSQNIASASTTLTNTTIQPLS